MKNISYTSTFIQNFRIVFHHRNSIFSGIIALIVFLYLGFWLIDFGTIQGNLGTGYARLEIILHIILSLLFALFISAQIYKLYYFSSFNHKQNSGGILGGFLGILITGCPSCSITLASYIGLSSLLSFLPWHGLELKIIGILLLIWVVWNSYHTLLVCKAKKHNKKHNKIKSQKITGNDAL